MFQENSNASLHEELESEDYRWPKIFSIVDFDQITLGPFIYACDGISNMSMQQQKVFLVIHIKNRLRGRAAQFINFRNTTFYLVTLLTALEPCLGQIIRAGNPEDLLVAYSKIHRELQLTYFTTS